jgi:hypothetical protein
LNILGPAAIPNGGDAGRLVLFLACILAAIAGGYAARKLRLVKTEWAGGLMSAAIVGCDAPIAWLAIWHLEMNRAVWKVPVAGTVVGVATCLAGLLIARRRRMAPADAAVFGLQGGMGNVGYTMGGAICLALWGMQGLALEQMFVLAWPFFAFLFCFPVGRHYGELAAGLRLGGAGLRPGGAGASPETGLVGYAVRTLWRSLTDLRSLPLYLATLGLVLNLQAVKPPEAVRQWHLIDALMVLGMFMQFGGVGMTVEARRLPAYWKKALGSAGLKFLVSPALMAGTALGLGMAGMPLWVCFILSAMPTALYSVLIANLFGLNKDLANTTFILTHAICLTVLASILVTWYGAG